MRGHEDRRPVGWLGFDRNPLRRGTDRIEAVLRLAMVILLVVAVPIAAAVAGQRADHLALNRLHAQQAADHLVSAVLLQNAPPTGMPDPYTSIQTVWVPARWQPPDQPPRTGDVLALAGAHRGSSVPTWIDASGTVTDPPLDHRDIAGDVCIAVGVTCLTSCLALLGFALLVHWVLERRRLNAWEAEWRACGPLWTGHRS